MPKCILTEQGGKGGEGGTLSLLGIAITTPPTKTSYLAEDQFDTTGMVVTASYGLSNVEVATAPVTGYSVTPNPLTDGTTEVIVTYSEMGSIATASQAVTVTHRLKKIEVTSAPTQTEYEYGDALNTAGLVVTATYSDGATAAISPTCAPTSLTTVTDSQAITVSYSENGVTEKTSFNVVVNRKSVAKPTWKGTLTYNGNVQSANNTGLWNNYNTTYMTMTGTMSAINASNYNATFTPNSNYCWVDGSTSAIEVTWNIAKKAGTLSLSSTSIAIDSNNLTHTITVNGEFDGTISINPTSVTGLSTLSVNNRTITVKGDGSTTVPSTTITVSVSAGTNYTAPAKVTFTVSATYWTFGAGTGEVADAAWFAGLKNYLATHSGASLTTTSGGSIVGTTKTVTLTTAVLGTTTHLIRVIGVDQDANNTVTWQTKNCLGSYTQFGSSAVWIGSTARSLCQNYYNYFPGKASIKTVSKGTCANYNNSRVGTATYNDETVFLLSEREFGLDAYSPVSTANSSTTNAECTSGKNFSYSYYSSDSSRIMYLGDNSTSNYGYPWERSRYYRSSDTNGVCVVNSNGTADNVNYYNSYGLAPAFVIG